jgi:hypothetical protein
MDLCRPVSVAAVVFCLCFAAGAGSEDSAKNLFREQLSKPTEKLNAGLSYWIELRRGGVFKRVNSTTTFKSGDRIRIHATPNIDGYAYMVMIKGSTGKESVLFPGPGEAGNNRVVHGKTYLIPSRGNLVFDRNPGKETLRLVLARQPVDARAFLKQLGGADQIAAGSPDRESPVLISRAAPQSPGYIFSIDDPDTPVRTEEPAPPQQEPNADMSKDLFVESPPAAAGNRTGAARTGHRSHQAAPGSASRQRTAGKRPPAAHPAAAITVVSSRPSAQFFADIILNHQ